MYKIFYGLNFMMGVKMEFIKTFVEQGKRNFIFIGEAGCGKSEIALNFALSLSKIVNKKVHFFDMDMTKPLFRSREAVDEMVNSNIIFHFEEQFMDAPTMVGGVNQILNDKNCFVVIDVGGDDIGAKSIGGFERELNRPCALNFYVLNVYRPWSFDFDHVDETLAKILGTSRVQLENVMFINNPNLGLETTEEEFIMGYHKMFNMVSPYKSIAFSCVHENLYEKVVNQVSGDVFSLHLYLTYPWNNAQTD